MINISQVAASLLGWALVASVAAVQGTVPKSGTVPVYNAGKGGGGLPLPSIKVRIPQWASMESDGKFSAPGGARVSLLIGKGGSKTEFAEMQPGFKPGHFGLKSSGKPFTTGAWRGFWFVSRNPKGIIVEGYDLIRNADGMSVGISAKTIPALKEGRKLMLAIIGSLPRKF